MAKYIDRDALLEKIEQVRWISKNSFPRQHFVVGDVMTCIRTAPAADVAEVVRCRECAHYKICDEWKNGKRMLCEIHHHSYLDHDGDNHFCSWGQRKEADHEVS